MYCSCVENIPRLTHEYCIPKNPYIYSQQLFETVAKMEGTPEDDVLRVWKNTGFASVNLACLIWEFFECVSRMRNEYEADDVV